jgi:hypothetical protein
MSQFEQEGTPKALANSSPGLFQSWVEIREEIPTLKGFVVVERLQRFSEFSLVSQGYRFALTLGWN